MQRNTRLAVNALLQVKDGNRLDVEEWLKYHVALGFDTIFVCDSGNHAWLEEVCEKLKDHVVLAPRSENWAYKSEIIRDYVSRREYEEWCICLDEHDFLWISPAKARSILQYVESIPNYIAAVTFYVKHMSSHEPMRYRVGTQLDCFTHTRREPEGFFPKYNSLPNDGVTLFRVNNQEMPLRDPVTPVLANRWGDAEFRQMTPKRFAEETSSRAFRPTAYPVRIYRFGIRSGSEVGFDDKKVPVGFDVVDLSMQKAREQYCHIPVNPETETLFAKFEPPQEQAEAVPAQVESAGLQNVKTPTPEEYEAMALPISRSTIDKLIFKGQFFEDILNHVSLRNKEFDRGLLERAFQEERRLIIESSPIYTEMQELYDQGKTDAEVKRALVLTDTTFERMRKALPVLDIETRYSAAEQPVAGSESVAPVQVGTAEPLPESAPVAIVKPRVARKAPKVAEVATPEVNGGADDDLPDAELVEAFEASEATSAPSVDELAVREEAVKAVDAKRKNKGSKKGSKKGAKKEPALVVDVEDADISDVEVGMVASADTAETVAPPPPVAEPATEAVSDDELGKAFAGLEDDGDDDILADASIDAVIGEKK